MFLMTNLLLPKTLKAISLAGSLLLGTVMPGGQASIGHNDAPKGRVRNIVLVHGAWADGSGWESIYKIEASHAVYISHAAEVAAIIEKAANGLN